ncbi:MAG: ThuA domain-containing protein [Bryobacteraceae bacterium]
MPEARFCGSRFSVQRRTSVRRSLTLFFLAAASLTASPIRTLIFAGQNNHDWTTTTPYLKSLLSQSGRFDVRVEEEPAGVTGATLANYDLIVVDYQGPRWGEDTERAVTEFVRSGKGLVAVHGASYAFSGFDILGPGHVRTGRTEPVWTAWAEMLGGTWAGAPPQSFHAPRHRFTVRFADQAQPIARGLGTGFETLDELYHQMRFLPNAHILATAYDDPANGGTGKDEPVLVTVNYGNGRVFYTALGHEVPAMQESGFALTFTRGAEWAATGNVTLPAELPSAKTLQPVKTLVVTGGHSFDPEFYSLFTGRSDLAATMTGHPDAYNHDFRKETDVLVLYDFIQEISDGRRENLKAFLESGGGLVVLHHAIADFGAWPWWSEEVVGGKYLLKPEGDRPASTYKHDEDVLVQAVGTHPITRGLAPLHFKDETYHSLWISPRSKILLQTNNSTSDGPVAWIGPYTKSRVVYIELGHDRFPDRNPDYQELVHRAILWAAGRMQ